MPWREKGLTWCLHRVYTCIDSIFGVYNWPPVIQLMKLCTGKTALCKITVSQNGCLCFCVVVSPVITPNKDFTFQAFHDDDDLTWRLPLKRPSAALLHHAEPQNYRKPNHNTRNVEPIVCFKHFLKKNFFIVPLSSLVFVWSWMMWEEQSGLGGSCCDCRAFDSRRCESWHLGGQGETERGSVRKMGGRKVLRE